jgi:hypothetical protein
MEWSVFEQVRAACEYFCEVISSLDCCICSAKCQELGWMEADRSFPGADVF